MKKKLLLLYFLAATFFATAQNIGIGTLTPHANALLHVDLGTSITNGLLISGTYDMSSTVPDIGGGTRMMFYPGKAAFRAGTVETEEWDNVNVGFNSFATGTNTTASGYASTAMGYGSSAFGDGATTMGNYTNAAGNFSTAMGYYANAAGDFSTAMGNYTNAKSGYETVLGTWNTDYTPLNTASWDPADRLFTIGNGTGPSSTSDALVVLKNGNTGIGNSTPGFPLSFATEVGDKISLWSNSANSYGFGIQDGLLQIHTDVPTSNITFGHGSSDDFTERMRIINNVGYDGMILNGRLILKNGSADPVGGGAGVWLYKADNSALLGFIGAQNNQNMGFFGGPGGWGFTYDAVNSRVGIGTSSPSATLHVSAGDASLALFGPNASGGRLFVGASANTNNAGAAQVIATNGNLHIDPAPLHNIYIGDYQPNDIYMNSNGGNVNIGGYTKLGEIAPSIKMIKLTGTTVATDGGFVDIATGVNYTKILSISVLVLAAVGPSSNLFPANFSQSPGYNYSWRGTAGFIRVINTAGNCANILATPIIILITYEE